MAFKVRVQDQEVANPGETYMAPFWSNPRCKLLNILHLQSSSSDLSRGTFIRYKVPSEYTVKVRAVLYE
jgi:hypothetical protein